MKSWLSLASFPTQAKAGATYLLLVLLAFALLFVFPLGDTFSIFFTAFTPSSAFTICSAFAFWAALATDPVSVTTPFSTSTLMVESRRSLAAANSKRALVQSQPSFKPAPMVLPACLASRWIFSLSFSYSSRVGALFVLAFALAFLEDILALAVAILAFAFALTLVLASGLQPERSTAIAAVATIAASVDLILSKPPVCS